MYDLLYYYNNKIEEILIKLYPELSNNPFHSHLLNKWVFELSEVFINEKLNKMGAYFKQKEYAAAYLIFIFPQSLIKIFLIMQEISTLCNKRFSDKSSITIIDLGSGMGPSTFGIFEYFKTNQFNKMQYYELVEKNELPIYIHKLITERKNYFINAQFNIIKSDLINYVNNLKKKADIIILSLVLSELMVLNKQINLIKKLINQLNDDGILIIIEPALKKCSHRLISLRNKIIKEDTVIYAPCLSKNPCELESNEKQWCFKEIAWEAPIYMQYINRKLYRDIKKLKFSYLVLSKAQMLKIHNKTNLYRSIAPATLKKGKASIIACNSKCEIKTIELLKRDLKGINKALIKIKAGQLFSIEEYEEKNNIIRIKKIGNIE